MHLRRGATTAIICAATVLSAVAPAHAAAKPRLTLDVPSQVNANVAFNAPWSTTKLPKGDHVVLQRQMGTGAVWHTVAKLQGSKGTATVPGIPMGRFLVRILVLDKHNKGVVSLKRTVTSFGPVSLLAIFGDDSGSYTTATQVFSYEQRLDGYADTTTGALTDGTNTCRSLSLAWMAGPEYQDPDLTATGTLTVVQESQDPVSATADENTLSALKAGLVPGQGWSVNLGDNGDGPLFFYLSGMASCYTPTGNLPSS